MTVQCRACSEAYCLGVMWDGYIRKSSQSSSIYHQYATLWAPIRAKQLSSIFVGWLLRIGLPSVLLTLSSWPKLFQWLLSFITSASHWVTVHNSPSCYLHAVAMNGQLVGILTIYWKQLSWICLCHLYELCDFVRVFADVTCFHVWMLWACKCRIAEQMHAILLSWDCAVSASFSGWSL